MLRTSGKASVAVGAAATIASVVLLAGCGNDSSTASSTPTLKTSTTAATAAPTTTSTADDAESTTEAAPTTTESEQAQLPKVTPTPVAPKLTAKDEAYLAALKSRGVVASSPDIPLQIGAYICQANESKAPPAEVLTYVSAMAGQDPSYNKNKIPVTQLGQSYIDAANQTLCKK